MTMFIKNKALPQFIELTRQKECLKYKISNTKKCNIIALITVP
jgi:hypothetical protein